MLTLPLFTIVISTFLAVVWRACNEDVSGGGN